jgi:UrcA family protein
MSRVKLKVSVLGAMVAVLASPLGAFAASSSLEDPAFRVVRFADLDLSRNSGVAALYSRIKSAAREVCQPLDSLSVKLLRAQYDCLQDAVARAVVEVNSPALTDFYAAKRKTVAVNQAQ